MITRDRLERTIGKPERAHAWEAYRHRTAMETVIRDPRPARAVVGWIMTALTAGVGMIFGFYVAMGIATQLIEVAKTIASAGSF